MAKCSQDRTDTYNSEIVCWHKQHSYPSSNHDKNCSCDECNSETILVLYLYNNEIGWNEDKDEEDHLSLNQKYRAIVNGGD